LEVFDEFLIKVASSFIDVAHFNKEFEKGYGLLCSVLINFGHMDIINKEYHFFTRLFGSEYFTTSFINIIFNGGLEIRGCGSGGEVDNKFHPVIRR
jgi:hypothetical protein